MSFTVATYNILADAYIKPAWYPHTPPALLLTETRIPKLLRHIAGLTADMLCLQEVTQDIFAALETHLTALGYAGRYTQKASGKPDGCATFYRMAVFTLLKTVRIEYADGPEGHEPSGHAAQLLVLQHGEHRLGVANTHLKWDPPGTPREQQYGYRQVVQLLREWSTQHAADCAAWIVCGDFNVTPESEVVAVLREAGLEFTHHAYTRAYTSNANARAKTIDYLFFSAALQAQPIPLPAIDDHTPLPGPDQPSDHVAVVARFEWTVGGAEGSYGVLTGESVRPDNSAG